MKISQSSWEAARTAVAAAAAVARTRDPSSPFLAITPRSSSGKQASKEGLAIDYRRGRLCAHIHRRRRSAAHAFGIWRPPQVVECGHAVHHGLTFST